MGWLVFLLYDMGKKNHFVVAAGRMNLSALPNGENNHGILSFA